MEAHPGPDAHVPGHPGVRVRGERNVDGLSLAEVLYPPGFTMPRHEHAGAYLTFALDGAYSEQMDGRERDCEPGSVVLRPPGEAHASRFHARETRCLRVLLPAVWLDALPRGFRLPDRSLAVWHGRASWLAAQLHMEFLARDDAAPLGMTGLTISLLAELGRAPSFERTAPRWLQQVDDRIQAEFRHPLTMADLAATAGVHPVHLARVFREIRGTTIAVLVRRLRLEWAARELRTSERPLTDVAQAAGFADQSHFTRAFRRAMGLTPKVYRERRRAR